MKHPITEKEALLKLAALCSRAEHCSWDLIQKMVKWQLNPDARMRVLARLIDGKYVDDARFVRFFINDKVKYNHWGRRKVEQALWAKHIERDVYQPILDEMAEADYADVLRPLLAAKRKTVKASNDYELKMKLIRFALGRGFTMDVISRCIDGAEDMEEECDGY